MTPMQAALLGLVQAATEFLPISSSGHLILAPRLLGWSDQGLEFDIATNTGTLLAVVAYFRSDLARLARVFVSSLRARGGHSPEVRTAWAIVIGTVPAALVGLAIKDWVSTAARGWRMVAVNAVVYGLLLLLADRLGKKRRRLDEMGPREGLWIGCAQALALVPGTSRSGVTMTMALALGFTRETAARFSFLLAVPIGVLVGGKQLFDLARGVPLGVPLDALAVGIAVSAIAGYGVIAFLLAWVRSRSFVGFALYRFALAAALWLYLGGSAVGGSPPARGGKSSEATTLVASTATITTSDQPIGTCSQPLTTILKPTNASTSPRPVPR
jgi:undecaprenyl-diphosphatase